MTLRTLRDAMGARRARLAIEPGAVGGAWPEAERVEPSAAAVAVVDVRGPLMQRAARSWWMGYDEIREAFREALGSSAHTVVLRIDSPGGECAGCFEAVRTMRAMADASGKRVVAYADEAAYSAAYAIATVASEIYLPESGGVGSVGVVSALLDVTAMNARAGVRVEVITSGARKADGNPDVPLTDDVIARERAVVEDLGAMFCDLVSESRPLASAEVAALEAACVYGLDAVDAGLADGVIGWDALLTELCAAGARQETKTMTTKRKKVEGPRARGAAAMLRAAEAETAMPPAEDDEEECEAAAEAEAAPPEAEAAMPPAEDDDEEEEAAAAAPPVARSSRDVLAYVRELTGQGRPADQVAALAAMGAELRAARESAKREALARREAELSATVDRAVRSGKLTPAQRAWALDTGRRAPDVLDAYLASAAPVVRTVAQGPTPAAKPADAPSAISAQVTDADRRVAAAMGVAPEKIAEHRTALVSNPASQLAMTNSTH